MSNFSLENPTNAATMLREARLHLELELDQVSSHTKIPKDQLEAIEEGRWTALPGAPYARAFSRTLAALYGIDPDEVVRALRNDLGLPVDTPKGDAQAIAAKTNISTTPSSAPARAIPVGLIVGLAAVLLVLAGVVKWMNASKASPAVSQPSPADLMDTSSTAQDEMDTTKVSTDTLAPLVQRSANTVVLRLLDPTHSAFVLYAKNHRIRKFTFKNNDSLEIVPDSTILMRNLSHRVLVASGAFSKDSLSWTYTKWSSKNDSVLGQKSSEAEWEKTYKAILGKPATEDATQTR